MITGYGLEISSGAGISIIVKVNDVPFKPKEAGSVGALSIPINGEVIPGENKVEVLIGTADITPESATAMTLTELPDDPSLTVKLQEDAAFEPSPGVYETKVKDLKSSAWDAELQDGKIKFPQTLTLTFNAPDNHPAPLWLNGATRDVNSIQGILVQAHKDIILKLQAKDTESIGTMRTLVYQDAATAYPLGGSAEERLTRGVSQISRILSRPNMTVPDLSEPLECKAYANGRLFECVGADGMPPVRLESPGRDPIYYKFRFSILDNKLKIVR
ncbi:hypothetical protein N9M10_02640 [Hellea sp.]|nr:hypothetical protein [Hellea sp.]